MLNYIRGLTLLGFAVGSLGLGSAVARADIIRVPGDYPTIQAGIDAAQDNDSVVVADGVYTGEGNINLDFNGKQILVRSENGPENCIIDCESAGRGFYFHNGETSLAEVNGFTIRNGNASRGGGIYCDNSSPTISNCRITGNRASDGGGISCYYNSHPTINNCTISANSAGDGGGVSCNYFSSPVIYNCTVNGNSSSGPGGGIACDYYSSPLIINSIISENAAGDFTSGHHGGGISCDRNSNPVIYNCTISENLAGTGGGIYCNRFSNATIMFCTISGNTVRGNSGSGGGIYCSNSNPTINYCVIRENSAQFTGGGIRCVGSDLTISNSIISMNTIDFFGAGIASSGVAQLSQTVSSRTTQPVQTLGTFLTSPIWAYERSTAV